MSKHPRRTEWAADSYKKNCRSLASTGKAASSAARESGSPASGGPPRHEFSHSSNDCPLRSASVMSPSILRIARLLMQEIQPASSFARKRDVPPATPLLQNRPREADTTAAPSLAAVSRASRISSLHVVAAKIPDASSTNSAPVGSIVPRVPPHETACARAARGVHRLAFGGNGRRLVQPVRCITAILSFELPGSMATRHG